VRRLMIVLSVGFIMVIVASATVGAAQMSPEDKAARKAGKQEQKAAKQQQKAAKQQPAPKQQPAAPKQQLPATSGPPVGTMALFTLGTGALVVVGGALVVQRFVVTQR
jgi:Flp pilus assembly protein TadB